MAKIQKVVYLISSPFNKRDYDRFGVEILQENGFEVEVWDFTPFLKPEVYKKVTVLNPVYFKGYFRFFSRKEAASALMSLESTVVVSLVPYDMRSYSLFRAITKTQLTYCVVNVSPWPAPVSFSWRTHFMNQLKKTTLEKIVNKIFMAIPFQYLKVDCASLALVAGGIKALSDIKMRGNGLGIIPAHSFDYDIYLRLKDELPGKCLDTAVFLDEYVPFHPDYVHLNLKPFSTVEQYYPVLCNYFDYLESELDLEVVVAAHPRSHYETHPDYFGGRRVVMGRTAELVKDAKIILSHSSTAVNFAVLFKKPTVFLTTNSLNASLQRDRIYGMAFLLGKIPINMDQKKEFECENIFDFDKELYSRYINQYIKIEGSQELLIWQIFADRIRET